MRFFRDGFAQGFPARSKSARAGRAAWYAIAQAARNAQQNQAVEFTGESDQLALNVAYGAAHGTKCFTLAAALTDGENIVLSYLDDLQFMSTADGVTGVPNSDADFGADYAEGKVLASKRENAAYYSENMAKAGSTVAIDANFDAIQNHVNGMSKRHVHCRHRGPGRRGEPGGRHLRRHPGGYRRLPRHHPGRRTGVIAPAGRP